MKYIVKEECILYDFLRNNYDGSKNNIKNFLKNGFIKVNNNIVYKYDYKLLVNDEVSISNNFINYDNYTIPIVYEDKDMIIVDKPFGLLTIGTSKDKDHTLYNYVSKYLKEKNKNNKVFIVHRLDKDTGGIIVLAKNEKTKELLQSNWHNTKRYYVAVVHGKALVKDSIVVNLKENPKTLETYVSKYGDKAITNYNLIKNNDKYSLIDIEILTGKKNQIRVSLAYKNLPILGDKKYGIKDNYKKLMLFANKLIINNKEYLIDIPSDFYNTLTIC